MKRREFLTAFGSAAIWPSSALLRVGTANVQPPKLSYR
jgi:hypothetical protein